MECCGPSASGEGFFTSLGFPPLPKSFWERSLFTRPRDREVVCHAPFGLLIDKWRWDVFAGKIDPAHYNASYWALRRRYQGEAPPGPRGEEDFDPGAKYHVASSTPYARYFLATSYQFQFHRALCQAAALPGAARRVFDLRQRRRGVTVHEGTSCDP